MIYSNIGPPRQQVSYPWPNFLTWHQRQIGPHLGNRIWLSTNSQLLDSSIFTWPKRQKTKSEPRKLDAIKSFIPRQGCVYNRQTHIYTYKIRWHSRSTTSHDCANIRLQIEQHSLTAALFHGVYTANIGLYTLTKSHDHQTIILE